MNNRILINLGLLLLVLLLGTIAIYEPGLEDNTQPRPPLTSLQPEAIQHIELNNPSHTKIALKKVNGRWQMIAPQAAPANEKKIKELLGIVSTNSYSRFPVDPQRLSEFGLDPAPIKLRLNNLELEFGGNDPLQFRRYVRIGNQLHLISNGFHHHLVAGVNDYLATAE